MRRLLDNLGGALEGFYFAFSEDDLMVLCDMPNNAAAAAFSLAIHATGAAKGRITVLMTLEEIDRAVTLTLSHRAPGQGQTRTATGRDALVRAENEPWGPHGTAPPQAEQSSRQTPTASSACEARTFAKHQ